MSPCTGKMEYYGSSFVFSRRPILKICNIGVVGVYKSPGKTLNDLEKEFNKIDYDKIDKDHNLAT